MTGLTPRQLDLLRFIRGFQLANGGVSPSVRECMRGLGLSSPSGVQRMMISLVERGAIRTLYARERAVEVRLPVSIPSIDGTPLYAVPLVGVRSVRFSEERL